MLKLKKLKASTVSKLLGEGYERGRFVPLEQPFPWLRLSASGARISTGSLGRGGRSRRLIQKDNTGKADLRLTCLGGPRFSSRARRVARPETAQRCTSRYSATQQSHISLLRAVAAALCLPEGPAIDRQQFRWDIDSFRDLRRFSRLLLLFGWVVLQQFRNGVVHGFHLLLGV